MPRHQGIQGEAWANCGRCGFIFPVSQLTSQKGLNLCPKDLDNLAVERRSRIISEILAEPETSPLERSEQLRNDHTDDLEF
jgi:hypothetical protein